MAYVPIVADNNHNQLVAAFQHELELNGLESRIVPEITDERVGVLTFSRPFTAVHKEAQKLAKGGIEIYILAEDKDQYHANEFGPTSEYQLSGYFFPVKEGENIRFMGYTPKTGTLRPSEILRGHL